MVIFHCKIRENNHSRRISIGVLFSLTHIGYFVNFSIQLVIFSGLIFSLNVCSSALAQSSMVGTKALLRRKSNSSFYLDLAPIRKFAGKGRQQATGNSDNNLFKLYLN